LIVLGTTESLTYALSRLELFDWESVDNRKDFIRPQGAMVKSVVFEIWPCSHMGRRAPKLVLFSVVV